MLPILKKLTLLATIVTNSEKCYYCFFLTPLKGGLISLTRSSFTQTYFKMYFFLKCGLESIISRQFEKNRSINFIALSHRLSLDLHKKGNDIRKKQ